MIITAGELKGRKIDCPSGKDVRPTSSKIRQAVFNVTYSLGFEISEIRMLELFAGTGIISFECISRGAESSVLVDNSITSIKYIEKNVNTLGLKSKVSLVKKDALDFVKNSDLKSYDLIFMDPPYKYEFYNDVIKNISERISDKTLLIMESNKIIIDVENDFNLEVIKIKNWGDTFMSFVKKHKS